MKHSTISIMSKALFLILILGLTALASSCGKAKPKQDKYSLYESVVDTSKPVAWGEDRDIFVFCDDVIWAEIQDSLKKSIEREIPIVVKERYFNLIRKDIKDIDELIKYKNLLFLGDLESNARVSGHIKSTMPPRLIDRVKNTGSDIFVAKNRWVKDQIVIYMVGSNKDNLLNINKVHKDRLFTEFVNRLGERQAYQAYLTKVIPEEFFKDFPFALALPENFKIYADDKKNHFVSFLYRIGSESKDFPDKYISVYYEDMDTDKVSEDWVLQKRKELAFKYYDQDEFNPQAMHPQKVSFSNYSAWHIIGAWRNLKHDIGGGFQSFAFYDAKQKKAYLVDNVVYYPAGDKLPVLLELQKISSTLKTKQ